MKHRPHEASSKELLLFRRKSPTEKCIGLPVRVWCPLQKRFYRGKIVKYDPTSNKHIVLYDHGAQETVDMSKKTWNFDLTTPPT